MQNRRVMKSQTWIKVSEIQWSQEVCDSVWFPTWALKQAIWVCEGRICFRGYPRKLVPKCPLNKAGDVERTWTKRGVTCAADSNTEGREPWLTPLQSWTISPSGFQPYFGVIFLCYFSLLPFWNGDIHIRVIGSMYFFIQWTFEQCSNCRTVGLLEIELNIFCIVRWSWAYGGSGVECYVWMFNVPSGFMRLNICCPTGGTALGSYENFKR